MKILVCNVGSTSLKFKLYEMPACEVFAQGAVAVSYTHLDVYKRQSLGSISLRLAVGR